MQDYPLDALSVVRTLHRRQHHEPSLTPPLRCSRSQGGLFTLACAIALCAVVAVWLCLVTLDTSVATRLTARLGPFLGCLVVPAPSARR